MGYSLEKALPWGRSLSEYIALFNLENFVNLSILDCGSGPASVNAELHAAGISITSCDPVYQFSSQQIEQRVRKAAPQILGGIRASHDEYDWSRFQSIAGLEKHRMGVMREFLKDFDDGLAQGRYMHALLPSLPFENNAFDLALGSYFLFSYSHTPGLGYDFHLQSLLELLRVAQEIRVFPVITLGGEVSPFLTPVMEQLTSEGFSLELVDCSYRFQRGADKFLRVSHT